MYVGSDLHSPRPFQRPVLRMQVGGTPEQEQDAHKPWKRWIFVINNYEPLDVEQVKKLADDDNVDILTSGYEVGKEGTPHIQGAFVLKNKQRLSWLKKFLSRAHFKPQYKSAAANINYTMKDGNVCCVKGDIEKYMEPAPTRSEKKREREEIATDVYQMMVNGCTEDQIRRAHPIYWMYNFRMIEGARKRVKWYIKHPDADFMDLDARV